MTCSEACARAVQPAAILPASSCIDNVSSSSLSSVRLLSFPVVARPSQPFQGNDNRSTAAWLPKAAVAPSAKWNSTYTVHYKHPAKRYS